MLKASEIGIDIGTANILVYNKAKGIIINEPSVVAIDVETKKVVATGREAKLMIGKAHRRVKVIRPLTNGVIADYDVTTEMLRHIMKKALHKQGFGFGKPNVVACIPFGSTTVERRAIYNVIRNAGANKVYLMEAPVACAIGADLPVDVPIANVVVDIGAGSTEIAIISLGGVVVCRSVRIGGDTLDDSIVSYIRKAYNVLIGEMTAEQIKIEIGFALVDHEKQTMEVRGRDLVTGLPKMITLSSYEIRDAMKESLQQILEAIRSTFEECPAELSGDILDCGVTLSGGSALLQGMQEWLSNEIIVPVHLASSPLTSVGIGAGRALPFMEKLQKANG